MVTLYCEVGPQSSSHLRRIHRPDLQSVAEEESGCSEQVRETSPTPGGHHSSSLLPVTEGEEL